MSSENPPQNESQPSLADALREPVRALSLNNKQQGYRSLVDEYIVAKEPRRSLFATPYIVTAE